MNTPENEYLKSIAKSLNDIAKSLNSLVEDTKAKKELENLNNEIVNVYNDLLKEFVKEHNNAPSTVYLSLEGDSQFSREKHIVSKRVREISFCL